MSVKSALKDGKVWAWSLYDWGNSAFATTVIAGFFPVFFKQYWSVSTDPVESTFHLGMANALAGVLVAALAPILGAIADRGGTRKKFLVFFTLLGILMTAGMYFVGRGEWQLAVLLYALGTVGFTAGIVFYDALIVEIVEPEKSDFVSSFGYALGYLGGGVLFAVNVCMALKPETFGFADAADAIRVSFVTVAIWWALFAIPVFLFVPETKPVNPSSWLAVVIGGWKQFLKTFSEIKSLRPLFLFLVAYWFYIDGVNTIIKMAVDYGLSIGFDSTSLIVALLLVQFVGFPAALLFGWLGDRFGPRSGLFVALGIYTLVTFWAYFLDTVAEFYWMAVAIGLVQGGIQSLSRSCYARMVPPGRSAEFFGFYGMIGKFGTIIGPALMGAVGLASGNPRDGILAVAVLFVIGGYFLYRVDVN